MDPCSPDDCVSFNQTPLQGSVLISPLTAITHACHHKLESSFLLGSHEGAESRGTGSQFHSKGHLAAEGRRDWEGPEGSGGECCGPALEGCLRPRASGRGRSLGASRTGISRGCWMLAGGMRDWSVQVIPRVLAPPAGWVDGGAICWDKR